MRLQALHRAHNIMGSCTQQTFYDGNTQVSRSRVVVVNNPNRVKFIARTIQRLWRKNANSLVFGSKQWIRKKRRCFSYARRRDMTADTWTSFLPTAYFTYPFWASFPCRGSRRAVLMAWWSTCAKVASNELQEGYYWTMLRPRLSLSTNYCTITVSCLAHPRYAWIPSFWGR